MKSKQRIRTARPLLSILVPVYNEENTLKKILTKVTTLPIEPYEVIVVDDASQDSSAAIIEKFAQTFKKKGVRLKTQTHNKNKGKGAGMHTALKEAEGVYFVIQDADLEYDPSDIPTLLTKAVECDLPVVYGSRFLGTIASMPKANYYANQFYNFLLRRLYNTSITDMHTCYKMVKTDLLRDLNMTSEGFGYATELVSKLLKRGIVISEEPISFKGRTKKEGKKIGLKDGIDCTNMIIKYKLSNRV
jgi:glycosyltransferase involved in cell wall biosynthesis